MDFYTGLKDRLAQKIEANGLEEESARVEGEVLSAGEAIGSPERRDFPLLRGREYMVEATVLGSRGQAFTDEPGNFSGTLGDIVSLPLTSNKNRAIFIATLNAVMNHLGLCSRTIHCRDEGPEQCAGELAEYIRNRYGEVRVGLVGFQPAMLDRLRQEFDLRVLDLDPDKVGKYKYGVLVEHGQEQWKEVTEWAEVLLVTGSTVVNGSITGFLELDRPVLFYGNTIAGAAALMGLERVCFYGE